MPRWQHGSCWASAEPPARSPTYLVPPTSPVPEPSTRATWIWRPAPRLGPWRERAGDGRGRLLERGLVCLGGGPGVRYTSPFAPAVGQKPRRNALCPSVAPAPRRAGQPSRRPIRPKRAAVSRLFAQNVKRDLARLENREIAGVLERGGLVS
jgi:hypothetical protein